MNKVTENLSFKYLFASQQASGEGENAEVKKEQNTQQGGTTQTNQSQSGGNPIRATPSMWRCSRIMHMQV